MDGNFPQLSSVSCANKFKMFIVGKKAQSLAGVGFKIYPSNANSPLYPRTQSSSESRVQKLLLLNIDSSVLNMTSL